MTVQVETVTETLQLAYIYKAEVLLEACLEFASDHLPTVMMTVGYKQLVEKNQQLMVTPPPLPPPFLPGPYSPVHSQDLFPFLLFPGITGPLHAVNCACKPS